MALSRADCACVVSQVTVGSLDLAANKDILQVVNVCEDRDKYGQLSRALRDHNTGGRVLIFVETKRGADTLHRSLRMDSWNALCIHGDKSQQVSRALLPACLLPSLHHSLTSDAHL